MGRQIKVLSADDRCDAQLGVQAAESLVSQKVIAFAGGYCSGASIPETDVLNKHGGIPFLAAASGNPILMHTLLKELKTQHSIWNQHVFAPVGDAKEPV